MSTEEPSRKLSQSLPEFLFRSAEGLSVDAEVLTDVPVHIFSAEMQTYIEKKWETFLTAHPELFDGPLLRVLSASKTPTGIRLSTTSDITYKQVIGVRSRGSEDAVPEESFQVVSMILIPRTIDGVFILRERTSGDWEHSLELPGGFIKPAEVLALDGNLNAIAQRIAAKEVQEGTFYPESISLLGALNYTAINELMLVFDVPLNIEFAEYQSLCAEAHGVQAPNLALSGAIPLHIPTKVVLHAYLQHVVV
ncbi:MAG: hypothetical protein AB203_00875 [Parcubacteria bacterium C7867-008]|nr:MAG: hypothetical protein AB203_00875 [Parcubacteria bacterium C7867-008]